MVKTQGMIHPETKFLSNCEPMGPDKLSTSKLQWWDRCKIDITIQKGRNQKKRVMGLKQFQNLVRIPLDLRVQE